MQPNGRAEHLVVKFHPLNVVIGYDQIKLLFSLRATGCLCRNMKKIIQNYYFQTLTILFFVLSLIIGFKPTVKSISEWHSRLGTKDDHELRVEFFYWYQREHEIWEFINKNIPPDELILINAQNCNPFFVAYYLAPRPVYYATEEHIARLTNSRTKYHILDMTWNSEKKKMEWHVTTAKFD